MYLPVILKQSFLGNIFDCIIIKVKKTVPIKCPTKKQQKREESAASLEKKLQSGRPPQEGEALYAAVKNLAVSPYFCIKANFVLKE